MTDEDLIMYLFLLAMAVLPVLGDRFNHPRIPPPPPVPPPLILPVLQPIFRKTPWQNSGRSRQEYSRTGFPLWPHPPYQSLKFENVPNEEVFPPALRKYAETKNPRYRTASKDNVRLEWMPNIKNADQVLKTMFQAIPLTMLQDIGYYVNGKGSTNNQPRENSVINGHTNGVYFKQHENDFKAMNGIFNANNYPFIDFSNINHNQALNNNNNGNSNNINNNNFNALKINDINQQLVNLHKHILYALNNNYMNSFNNTGQNALNNNFNPPMQQNNFNNLNNNGLNPILNNNRNDQNSLLSNNNGNSQNTFKNNNGNGQNAFFNNNNHNNDNNYQFASNIEPKFNSNNNNNNPQNVNINNNQDNNFSNEPNDFNKNNFGNDFQLNEEFTNDNPNNNGNVNSNKNAYNNHYSNSNFINRRLASVEENDTNHTYQIPTIQKRDAENKNLKAEEGSNNFEEQNNINRQDNGIPNDDDELESQDLPEQEMEAFFSRNGLGGGNPPWFENADPELGLKSVQVVLPIAQQIEPFMMLTNEQRSELMRTLELHANEEEDSNKTPDDSANKIKDDVTGHSNINENILPVENSGQRIIRKRRQTHSVSHSSPLTKKSQSPNPQRRQYFPLRPSGDRHSSPPFLHPIREDLRLYNSKPRPTTSHLNSKFVNEIQKNRPLLYNKNFQNSKLRLPQNQDGRTLIQRNVNLPNDLRQSSSNKFESILEDPSNFLGKDFTKYWATNNTGETSNNKENGNTNTDYADDDIETEGRYSKFDDEFETSDTETVTDQNYYQTTPNLQGNENVYEDLTGLPEEQFNKDKYVSQSSLYTQNSPALNSMGHLSQPNALTPNMHYERDPYFKPEIDYMGHLTKLHNQYIQSPPDPYLREEHFERPNPFITRHPEDHLHLKNIPPPHLMRHPLLKEPISLPYPPQDHIHQQTNYVLRQPHFNPFVREIPPEHELPPEMVHHMPPEIHSFIENKPEELQFDPQIGHYVEVEPNVQYRKPDIIQKYRERDPQVLYEKPTLVDDYLEIEPEVQHQKPIQVNDYVEENPRTPKYAKPILVAEYIEEESPEKYEKPTVEYAEESPQIQLQTPTLIQDYEERRPLIQNQQSPKVQKYVIRKPQTYTDEVSQIKFQKPTLLQDYELVQPQIKNQQALKTQNYVVRQQQVKQTTPAQIYKLKDTKLQTSAQKDPTEIKFHDVNYKVKYVDDTKQPKIKLNHFISQPQGNPTAPLSASKPSVLNTNKKPLTASHLLPVSSFTNTVRFPFMFRQPLITNPLMQQQMLRNPNFQQSLITNPILHQSLMTNPTLQQSTIRKPTLQQPLKVNPTLQTGIRLIQPLQPSAALQPTGVLPIRPAPEAFLHAPLLIRRKENSHAQSSLSNLQRITDENQVENPKLATASQTISVTTSKPPAATSTRRHIIIKNPSAPKTKQYPNVALKSPVTYQQNMQQSTLPVSRLKESQKATQQRIPQKSSSTYYRNFTYRDYLGSNTMQTKYREFPPMPTTKRPTKKPYLRPPNTYNQEQNKPNDSKKFISPTLSETTERVKAEADTNNIVGYLHDEEYFGKRIEAKENKTNNNIRKNVKSYSQFTTERSLYDDDSWNDESSIQSSVYHENRKPTYSRFQDRNPVTLTGDMWRRGKRKTFVEESKYSTT